VLLIDVLGVNHKVSSRSVYYRFGTIKRSHSAQKSFDSTFTGDNLAVFSTGDSDFEGSKPSIGTCFNQNTTFGHANRAKIATCGLDEETDKRRVELIYIKKVTKPLYFTIMRRRHFAIDLHQIW